MMECNLSEIISDPDDEILELLLLDGLYCNDSFLTGPVVVQVTYFQCGGMSIGLSKFHKVLDMGSMCSFVNDWASLARNSNHDMSPKFNLGSLYPPLDVPYLKEKQQLRSRIKDYTCASKRLVFDGLNIAKLKAMIGNQVSNPMRDEVVSALLCKSIICANARAISSSYCIKSSIINHAINLRTRVSPPLSKMNIGNMSWTFPVSVQNDRDVELGRLVKEFRKSKAQISDICGNISNGEELCALFLKNMTLISEYFSVEHEVYICTSWCKFPFYEADFGWKKLLWVTTIWDNVKSIIILIDTREGDGIEAYIPLEEKVMAAFEFDKVLLSFSRVNSKTGSGQQ